MHGRVHVAYACVDFDCPEFRNEIPFKEGRMSDPRNSNFWKKGKIVISVKNLKFIL